MPSKKYFYNAETCQYEVISRKKKYYFIQFFLYSIFVLSASLGIFYTYTHFTETPKEKKLRKKNDFLEHQVKNIQLEITEANYILQDLQKKDDDLYRTIFEVAPIDPQIRQVGMGGVDPYDIMSKHELIVDTSQKIQQLKQRLYIQVKSYIYLLKMAAQKEVQWKCIPLMQPIAKQHLKKLASGFGLRNDPFTKVKKMHHGIDLVATKGTPVYATGDGVVRLVHQSNSYGNQIEINHGFGYVTKYAHLHKWHVKQGQKIKRGQLIAEVGSTGRSQAPHLHYEVIKKGKKVNPMLYFVLNQITPEAYHQAFIQAKKKNQSLD